MNQFSLPITSKNRNFDRNQGLFAERQTDTRHTWNMSGPPGVKNYTYFSLVDKRLASYHQSLLARGAGVRINLENIFNKLSMALWLVLLALSDSEKHPDITTFITHHLWPKIVLESQNSVSLGIISNNDVKFNKESLYWVAVDVEMFDHIEPVAVTRHPVLWNV